MMQQAEVTTTFSHVCASRAINCVRSRGLLNKKVKEAIVRKAKCETRDGRAERLSNTDEKIAATDA